MVTVVLFSLFVLLIAFAPTAGVSLHSHNLALRQAAGLYRQMDGAPNMGRGGRTGRGRTAPALRMNDYSAISF